MIVKTILVKKHSFGSFEVDSIGPVSETANDIRLETAYEHQTKNAIYLGLCYRIRIDRRTPRGIKFWIGHENVFLVYGFIPTFSDSSSPAKCTFFCLAILVFSVVSSPKYRALDIRTVRIAQAFCELSTDSTESFLLNLRAFSRSIQEQTKLT